MVFCNIKTFDGIFHLLVGHNPYFNRWFSAISEKQTSQEYLSKVTILILIDGFLQFIGHGLEVSMIVQSQSLF